MENIGKRIRAIRDAKGLKQEYIAYVAHVHQTTIAKIENGHIIPRLKTLSMIAKALEVPINDLMPPTTANGVLSTHSLLGTLWLRLRYWWYSKGI
ncbi:Helix-turn-helix [bacterium A37T11]|nr:Helix-turn-helix [bacterium A37T11]